MGAEPGTELGRRLWAVIEKDKLGKFSLRDIYQNKRRSFPMSDLTIAAAVLTKMGYVRPVGNSWATRKAGRPSSPVFEVNPLTRPQNTQNTQNSTDRCNSGILGILCTVRKILLKMITTWRSMKDGSEFYCWKGPWSGCYFNSGRRQNKVRPKSRTPPDLVEALRSNKRDVLLYLNKDREDETRETQKLLSWAAYLAEENLILSQPVTYVEAPLRTITTYQISWYAAHYLAAVTHARSQQQNGGWGMFTTGWWQSRENDAFNAFTQFENSLWTCAGIGAQLK